MGKKQWLFSGKVFTSLILIIFPILYAILSLFYDFSLPFIENEYLMDIPSPYPIVIPPIPLLIVLLIFALYPALYYTPIFFKKRGFENIILEYGYTKKILLYSIIILIGLLSTFLLLLNNSNAIGKTFVISDPEKDFKPIIERTKKEIMNEKRMIENTTRMIENTTRMIEFYTKSMEDIKNTLTSIEDIKNKSTIENDITINGSFLSMLKENLQQRYLLLQKKSVELELVLQKEYVELEDNQKEYLIRQEILKNELDFSKMKLQQLEMKLQQLENRYYELLSSIYPNYQLILTLYNNLFFILPIPISIIIRLSILNSKKYFKLFFAKGCFKIVLKETSDEIDKAKYFLRGLTWYNKFLEKTINLKINNIDIIYEKILIKSPLDNNDIILSISNSFEDKDEFAPLRHISTIFPNLQGEKILTKETLRIKIRESSDLIIPIVTTVIAIITTFFFKPPS